MSNQIFYNKYLKYKNKYIKLKKLRGGGIELGNTEEYTESFNVPDLINENYSCLKNINNIILCEIKEEEARIKAEEEVARIAINLIQWRVQHLVEN